MTIRIRQHIPLFSYLFLTMQHCCSVTKKQDGECGLFWLYIALPSDETSNWMKISLLQTTAPQSNIFKLESQDLEIFIMGKDLGFLSFPLTFCF